MPEGPESRPPVENTVWLVPRPSSGMDGSTRTIALATWSETSSVPAGSTATSRGFWNAPSELELGVDQAQRAFLQFERAGWADEAALLAKQIVIRHQDGQRLRVPFFGHRGVLLFRHPQRVAPASRHLAAQQVVFGR